MILSRPGATAVGILADMIQDYVNSIEARLLGRAFTLNDTVHFVLSADPHSGLACCSRRLEGEPDFTQVPLADICRLLDAVDDVGEPRPA